jgi:aminoglycoside 6'-N-acetyltransferase
LTVAGPDLSFHPLTRRDFPLLSNWLARPHVAEWWGTHQPTAVEEEFGPCVDGTDPTRVFVCLLAGTPVGLLQVYRLDDNPDYARAVGLEQAAGMDLFLGDAERCNRGLGPDIIAAALDMIWAAYPEVTRAMAGPSVRNARSIRTFEKSGFTAAGAVRVPGEEDEEMVLLCPRPIAA